MFFKEFAYAHQGYIFLIKNTDLSYFMHYINAI